MATQKAAKSPKKKPVAKSASPIGSKAKFPRHSVAKAIRIPQAILDQNAGKACSRADAAKFLGLGSPAGPFGVEISSALKYGLLEQPGLVKFSRLDWRRKYSDLSHLTTRSRGIAKL